MNFQAWLHQLLADCCEKNKVRQINAISPWEMRKIYDHGTEPSVEGVLSYFEQAA